MTQNQINYAKLQEEKRHNLATEGYTGLELAETSRHNQSSEGISWYSAQEAQRHNVQSENLNWYTAAGQREYYLGRATRDLAEANLATTRAEYVGRDYDLELSRFNQQVWKELHQVGIDESKLELTEQDLHKSWEKIDAEIAHLFYQEGLDFEKYKTEYAKARGNVFRDVSNGFKTLVEAATSLFNWGWNKMSSIK